MSDKYSRYYHTPEYKKIRLEKNSSYRECPVNIVEFCTSVDFLGLGSDIYPNVLRLLSNIFMGKRTWKEIVLLAGIGGGKSFIGQVITVYLTYQLLCLKDPQRYFGLAMDKPLDIMNMGLSEIQAKDVIFSGIRVLVEGTPWFNRWAEGVGEVEILKKTINFYVKDQSRVITKNRHILRLLSGNSLETTPLGRNLFCGVMDEAAFYDVTGEGDSAEKIYNSLNSRITSRFGRKGKLVVISSPRYGDDFIAKKYNEGVENPDLIFVYKGATRRLKNRKRMSEEVFVFDRSNYTIHKDGSSYLEERGIQPTEDEKEKLLYSEEIKNETYLIIPSDFENDFRLQPEKALRDLGTIVGSNIEAFIKKPEIVDNAMGRVDNRFDIETQRFDLTNPPEEEVFVHIDIGLNRTKQGDKTGFSCCRNVGRDENDRPLVLFDIVAQIKAGEKGEVQMGDLRDIIFDMVDYGRNIAKVTLDQFQSFDTIQILNNKGIPAEYLSVDRNIEPYGAFKEGLYGDTVGLPSEKVLRKELKSLELIKGMKVDHPRKGSKDVSDSVVGAYFSCIKYEGVSKEDSASSVKIVRKN